jgi:ABC-2 type transport system permease protein
MNAVAATSRAPVAAPHATHKLKLLLKREFWEHKGGFFWAPIVAGGISLLLTLMAVIVGEITVRRAISDGSFHADGLAKIDGSDVTINGLDLGAITGRLGPEELRNLGHGVDVALSMSAMWPFIVLTFVVFFYCLGALYDDRKDRSVLFWKSLPLSDRDTVLSKVASALVVAPILAVGAALATMLGFLVLISLVVLLHGGNPVTLLWGPGSPLAIAGRFLAAIPVYVLWALPTVGWLLLCSAWARSKPFLWAIMIPLFAAIFVAWFDVMQVFDLDTAWFLKNITGRALLSAVPGSWMSVASIEHLRGPEELQQLMSLKSTYSTLATPQLWIGAVAGVAMILGAIRLRRWRDDN